MEFQEALKKLAEKYPEKFEFFPPDMDDRTDTFYWQM